VRAHLAGGVPKVEVAEKAHLFNAHGFNPAHAFVERNHDYWRFSDSIGSKEDLRTLVSADSGVKAREAQLRHTFAAWWDSNAKFIVELPETRALMAARSTILDSFVTALTPIGLLDQFEVAGVIASWWGDVQFDLRTLAAGGFSSVIDGWLTTTTTALDDKKSKGNPLDHPLVQALVHDHLDEIEQARTRRMDLEAKIQQATGEHDEEDGDGDDDGPISLKQLAVYKKELAAAKKAVNALGLDLVAKLQAARAELSQDEQDNLVLSIVQTKLANCLTLYVDKHRILVLEALENWWDKYAVTLNELESERSAHSAKLDGFLRMLGYE
jgi:type I restriction enzyme M protein